MEAAPGNWCIRDSTCIVSNQLIVTAHERLLQMTSCDGTAGRIASPPARGRVHPGGGADESELPCDCREINRIAV